MSFQPYDPRMSSRGPNGGRELTQFDKLAIAICWFGAAVLIGLHVLLVPQMEYVYTDLDELIPGFTNIVKSPGYAVSMALLMVFLAYQGSRMRRLYDSLPRLLPGFVFSDRCDTPVLPPRHGDSSGVRGAARLWRPEELGQPP